MVSGFNSQNLLVQLPNSTKKSFLKNPARGEVARYRLEALLSFKHLPPARLPVLRVTNIS